MTTIGPMSEAITAMILDIAGGLVVTPRRSVVGPMVTSIATVIRIVVRRAVRVFERMANKPQSVPLVELVRMVYCRVFVGSVSFS